MSNDDIVYLSLLFSSIGFGYIYRRIKEPEQKKWIGTGVGVIVVLIVSGVHMWHAILSTLINAWIILYVGKRHCHVVSFVFSFAYLTFFRTTIHFGIPYPPAHTNLVQMMLTLKLVGLAFELNASFEGQKKKDNAEVTDEQLAEREANYVNPTFMDVMHYSFNYAGVLTGPYYRYRTFHDSLHLPFSANASWLEETLKKLTYIPLYAALFLWGSYNWPISYATTDEFFERSVLYRLWFMWPNFFIFRMRIYIGLVLSECVCTMAGIGPYPTISVPKPGQGPSDYVALKELVDDPQSATTIEYNFETIHNVNPYGADFCVTFRDAMKHWNVCIQYWLAVNVYKRFPYKNVRTMITMLVSAFWHGVYAGYYLCILGVPFYLPVEDIYVKLYLKENTGKSKQIWEWIIWFFKMAAFSYLAMAFLLLSIEKTMHYYRSVYFLGHILGVVLYVVGLQLMKARRAEDKRVAAIAATDEKIKSN